MRKVITIHKVGVVGAGQMGAGIAQVCAMHGYEVLLYDVDKSITDTAMASITARLQSALASKKISKSQYEAGINRLTPTCHLQPFAKVDILIEAVVEDAKIKSKIFEDFCALLPPHAIVASNTSSISITRLAASSRNPEQFIGLHFMNPVPLMGLVEIVRGISTSKETFARAKVFVESLKKQVASAEDFPAFIVNRILLPMINEAIYVLYEGVGDVESVDKAMRLGANHPMGPLQLADFIGLDTCLAIMQVLYDGLADSKYRPCPLLVKYVDAGWLGKKTGRGFYDYSGTPPRPTR